ncbi:hypothetical protein [Streptomyces sp. KS 21]|uniref:hypothetical protein n=1 Tax=Streptomyces sp. KS 21 TaxID=2485150 RepID=UPI001062D962|nr:hypothetical protein [Streptomyces sp. KS 21]TDU74354.1 hypothetical protein EDD91_0996 [Streptomyces sp. KS 21]
MNDPITLAATQDDDRRELPDTTGAATATSAEPIRTLLETAGTCRPLEEVAELVGLLKDTGQSPDHGHQTLRAAAVGRPVQDVALLVGILGTGEDDRPSAPSAPSAQSDPSAPEQTARAGEVPEAPEAPEATPAVRSARPASPARRADPAGQRPVAPQARYEQRNEPLFEEPYDEPYDDEPYESSEQYRRRPYGRTANGAPAARAGSGALRHVLRRPVAAALLLCGVLHLPGDLTALPSQTPTALLPLLATVLCLGLGALLAVRDTAAAWRAGAAGAVAVVALHVVGAVAGFDPLEGAASASLAWAGATAVFCAAAAAVLAGLALLNRSPQARAGAGG